MHVSADIHILREESQSKKLMFNLSVSHCADLLCFAMVLVLCPSEDISHELDLKIKKHLIGEAASFEAKALAEKNQRDLQTQREQAERHRLAETLEEALSFMRSKEAASCDINSAQGVNGNNGETL